MKPREIITVIGMTTLCSASWCEDQRPEVDHSIGIKRDVIAELWDDYRRVQNEIHATRVAAATPSPQAPAWSLHGSTTAYVGAIRYDGDTPRRDAQVAGVYLGLVPADLLLAEFDYEQTRIRFLDGSKLIQSDFTALASRWFGAWWLRGGVHLTRDDDHGWRAARTAVGSLWWTPDPRFSLGADSYASRFAVADPAVTVWQTSPGVHWLWGYNDTAHVGQRIDVTVIHLNTDVGFGTTTCWSVGTGFDAHWGSWWWAVDGWIGQRLYAMSQGGFAPYGLPALYRNGVSATIGHSFGACSLSAVIGHETYQQSPYNDTARANRLALSFSYGF